MLDEPFELAGHLARGAEIEPRRELVLDETETDLLEAGTVRDDPVAITGGGQDLAAEQRQRRRARLQRSGRVAGASQRCGLFGEAEHLERIDRARVRPPACNRHSSPSPSAGSPSARRNRDTFVCSTLRAVPTAWSAQRSSINLSVRTITTGLEGETNQQLRSFLPRRTGMHSTVAVQLDDIEH